MKIECTKQEWTKFEFILMEKFDTSITYKYPLFHGVIIQRRFDDEEEFFGMQIEGKFIDEEE